MQKNSARYTNGKTSDVVIVYPKLYKQGLILFRDETFSAQIDKWAYEDIKVSHDWSKGIGGSFAHKAREGASLSIENKDLFAQISKKLEKNDRATYLVSTRVITLFSLAAISIGTIFFGFPFLSRSSEKLAYLIPESLEDKIGEMVIEDINDEFTPCEDKEAEKYLNILAERLLSNSNSKSTKLKFHLYQTSTQNAFALPASNVVVLSGFLKNAEDEEEIAGVLAHEFGHIISRDPLKYVMQEQGLGFISSLASSGSGAYGDVAGVATTLSSLSYSRDKELAADKFAKDMLHKSGYTTDGLISFLSRSEQSFPEIMRPLEENLSFLSTHPRTSERIEFLEEGNEDAKEFTPSLSPAQIKRLQSACANRSLSKTGKD